MAPATIVLAVVLVACGGGGAGDADGLSGSVSADGSSTVFPITAAMAEEFGIERGGSVRVPVGQSGTGGGFKRFCAGETDLSNASRPITDSERQLCAQNGVEFEEFRVAIDGLSVTVNPANDFVECLTVAELKRIWEPGSTVTTWRDVRPEWPAQEIKLYGPGTNSGTFDYFTEVVVGEARSSRPDYTASEDDNMLVQGVEGDRQSLGYFGYAYYIENESRLKLVGVDGGSGCVKPTPQTVQDGTYAPLSRPLFVYANRQAFARAEVQAFLRFYFENAAVLVPQVGYVALPPEQYEQNLARLTG
jgi:phosphate transport system substrate-binding protein